MKEGIILGHPHTPGAPAHTGAPAVAGLLVSGLCFPEGESSCFSCPVQGLTGRWESGGAFHEQKLKK